VSSAAAAPRAASKTAGQENFPVASLLLAASKRATIMAYYRFARHADDIADSADLTPEDKVARLDRLDAALMGGEDSPEVALAVRYRRAVGGDAVLIGHASRLLPAFRRDSVRDHCADWADLMAYCDHSAAPVGRFLLDLHGESHDTFPPADALCAALQVLNHLQDCGKDYLELKRVYLPRDWMRAAGMSLDMLEREASTPQLRAVIARTLDATDGLIRLATPLPGLIRDTRLKLQTAITLRVAERLSRLLRKGDPLAGRVALGRMDKANILVSGIIRGLTA